MTPYRHVCPAPCDDPDCAQRHPDGVVCHDSHRSYWHRTHPPAACVALQRTNIDNDINDDIDNEGEAA